VLDVRVLWSEADAPASTDDLLDGPERARMAALRAPADRDGFRSAHLLARVAVGRLMAVAPSSVQMRQRCGRCGGPHGRPVAAVPGRARAGVSLSRAGALVVAAAAFAAIGVDHEPCGAADPAVAAVALARRERRQLNRLSPARQADGLLRWWVRKEAVLKMTGHGLLVDPSHLEISAPDEEPRLVAWAGPGPRPEVELADLALDGTVAAVAVGTTRPLRVHLERVALNDVGW
jgi:4'-phosphopantetheinyl transferase